MVTPENNNGTKTDEKQGVIKKNCRRVQHIRLRNLKIYMSKKAFETIFKTYLHF